MSTTLTVLADQAMIKQTSPYVLPDHERLTVWGDKYPIPFSVDMGDPEVLVTTANGQEFITLRTVEQDDVYKFLLMDNSWICIPRKQIRSIEIPDISRLTVMVESPATAITYNTPGIKTRFHYTMTVLARLVLISLRATIVSKWDIMVNHLILSPQIKSREHSYESTRMVTAMASAQPSESSDPDMISPKKYELSAINLKLLTDRKQELTVDEWCQETKVYYQHDLLNNKTGKMIKIAWQDRLLPLDYCAFTEDHILLREGRLKVDVGQPLIMDLGPADDVGIVSKTGYDADVIQTISRLTNRSPYPIECRLVFTDTARLRRIKLNDWEGEWSSPDPFVQVITVPVNEEMIIRGIWYLEPHQPIPVTIE